MTRPSCGLAKTMPAPRPIATLRRIHAAQTDHYGASRLYATIAMLKDTSLVAFVPVTNELFFQGGTADKFVNRMAPASFSVSSMRSATSSAELS